ncbi:MFS transporter [Paraburkholderia sp. C35]|uniref:MFS transporter n=1 Tax=Paraburkholderia sp. C35 TaxID=2126993 RepID=UPI000D69AABA|nr:MFS transporter [Paraburkholderia sp. C35]
MSNTHPPRRAWGIATLLFLFMAVNFADKIAVGLLAVPMMDELKLSPAQFGLIGSSFFWLFAVAGIVGGFTANRVATTGLLLAMGVVWSLLQVPMALSSSLIILIAARILLGVAEGPAFPVAIHACYKWFPDNRRDMPAALIAQGSTIGLLAAGMLMPLITLHWGWRANFLVMGAATAIWVVIWKLLGREGRLDAHAATAASALPQPRISYARLLREPTIVACFVLHFVAYWALALTLTWLPAFLQRALGYGNVESGRLYALIVALSVPVSMGSTWLARRMLAHGVSSRHARGTLSSILLVLAGAAFVAPIVFDVTHVTRIVLIAVAVGMAPVIYALVPSVLAEIVPAAQRGAILAIDNSIASIAGALAPLITGFLVQGMTGNTGYDVGFALGGGIMLVGAMAGVLFVDPEKARHSLGLAATAGRVGSASADSRSPVGN